MIDNKSEIFSKAKTPNTSVLGESQLRSALITDAIFETLFVSCALIGRAEYDEAICMLIRC